MTNETTKPVVTQAALKPCPWCAGTETPITRIRAGGIDWWMVECVNPECDTAGPSRTNEAGAITAWNTRAHSPSEPSVVSQDLVPVAWMQPGWDKPENYTPYCPVTTYPRNDWLPLYPASTIEAAQIAARNEALEEAAKVFTDYQQRVKDGGSDTTVMWTAERAAYAIRSLRTPSQHQEEQ